LENRTHRVLKVVFYLLVLAMVVVLVQQDVENLVH